MISTSVRSNTLIVSDIKMSTGVRWWHYVLTNQILIDDYYEGNNVKGARLSNYIGPKYDVLKTYDSGLTWLRRPISSFSAIINGLKLLYYSGMFLELLYII